MSLKRCKLSFQQLVLKSTCPKTVLALDRICASSRRARNYMKLYKAIEQDKINVGISNSHSILEDSMKLFIKINKWIEKSYKTHRNIIDKDLSTIKSIEEQFPLYNYDCAKADNKQHLIVTLVKKMGSVQ